MDGDAESIKEAKLLIEEEPGITSSQKVEGENFSNREIRRGNLPDILQQRHSQRRFVFWFSLFFSGLSYLAFISLICVQVWIRIYTGKETFSVLDGYELELLSVSIFGQFIGVILIITKAIWTDSDYIAALEEDMK